MRKIYLLFILLFTIPAHAQNIDSLIGLIYKEKTDSARIGRFYQVYDLYYTIDPVRAIETQKQILAMAKRQKDKELEAVATSELGDIVSRAGATIQGTSLLLDAMRIAESTGNLQVIGITYHNLALFTRDQMRRKQYMDKALQYSTQAGDPRSICFEEMNFSNFYLQPDHLQLDSALYHTEKGYQLAIAKNIDNAFIHFLLLFSKIHQKLANNGLALEYIRSAERLSLTRRDNDSRCRVYMYYSNYYEAQGLHDSALFYAYKGLDFAKRTFFTNMAPFANSLRLLYARKNADSALKYTNLYYSMKDSVLSVQALQQTQVMHFEETLRQEKLDAEKREAKENHVHNLQYVAIAIGLVVFVILFLLFSHSIIANPRVINFLGILSLLIVFEFINLLAHPYLAELTHHSPIAMLGFMVCLAGLLIPLHHKLEHWLTHKLIQKNNKIRLAKARKVIAQLEREQIGISTGIDHGTE